MIIIIPLRPDSGPHCGPDDKRRGFVVMVVPMVVPITLILDKVLPVFPVCILLLLPVFPVLILVVLPVFAGIIAIALPIPLSIAGGVLSLTLALGCRIPLAGRGLRFALWGSRLAG